MRILSLFSGIANCARCGLHFPTPSRRAALPSPNFPIDVVYTWVDGDDPRHLTKRTLHLPPDSLEQSAGANLFRDNRELLYSLRSLAEYAPWVRRVHLVTDGQRPDWLSKHPDLAVVDHAEIIPRQYLPTFNSHVIEAYLHRIPGLAEHYIYFNDDFFLTAPAGAGDFFASNGLPFLFTDWRASRRDGYVRTLSPHACSYWNTLAELAKRGAPSVPDVITAHAPCPQTKSNAEDAFSFFADAITGFSGNRFRTGANEAFSFFANVIAGFSGNGSRADGEMAFYCHAASLWAWVFKRAVPCDVPWWYVNVKRRDRRRLYASLLARTAEDRAPLFLCLNDVPAKGRRWFWRRQLAAFLAKRWPAPSPFETRETVTVCRRRNRTSSPPAGGRDSEKPRG
ncbi:MAG: Stealth CR1 domain-containing protein [Desulfovibrio sp.]|jgi:hypothetical protein|nr:Stealth CR1 domain-containing protein [Desulfovibrio sp.]